MIPLYLVPALPLVLMIALAVPALRGPVRALLPFAPLPALLVSLAAVGPGPVQMDWLLLGTTFALTGAGAAFLFFTACLWGLAGWQAMRLMQADPRRDRFAACFLAAMTGNMGLLIAQDMASFYTFFAMMSLSAWGLVLHGGGSLQRFAGKVYITFAVVGEVALFAGLALSAFATGETSLAAMAAGSVPLGAMALVALGLLIKLGTVPLHLWLPLAHSAAPAPASAVLSGAMLKAGLFGLMTLLPLGTVAVPELGLALAAMALAGLVLAPLLGLVQGDPKAVLAYSSVGQTSLMALGIAVALVFPASWPAIGPALILLAIHHGFAKAALFLGVPAIWASARGIGRGVVLAALALPALALAGLPWTSGFAAKSALKSAMSGMPEAWSLWLALALTGATLGTTLLMIRALYLLGQAPAKEMPAGVTLPAAGAVGLAGVGLWFAPVTVVSAKMPVLADVAPIAAAAALATLGVVGFRLARWRLVPPQPGELLSVVQHSDAAPAPTPALPHRRHRPLGPRRIPLSQLRPERGGLAILGTAAALVLVALLSHDAPAPVPPPPPATTTAGG